VIMGDCDLTYDFRLLKPFVEALDAGFEFVMGTRVKGYIEPAAMPRLHRYFGSPATTWVFNAIYGTRYSDIHCGMRALTREALVHLDLQAQSWEYASEMILKARRLRMRATEVPVRFYKDREGRESHLKRIGWRAPWIAGWQSLRVMFIYAPDFFLRIPGWLLLVFGTLLCTLLATGPVDLLGVGLDLHWMLVGLVSATLGYSALQLSVLARVHYAFDRRYVARLTKQLSYNRGMAASAALILAGLVPNALLVGDWMGEGLRLTAIDHPAIFGLLLLVLGFQTFAFTLLLHIVAAPHAR
jgi:hypothetical protein